MKLGLQQRLYNAEIRSRRIRLGLSQHALALKIGVTTAAVGQIETLRRVNHSPTVIKLAEFFGVSPETLCPLWLKEIRKIPRLVRTEKEFEREGLAFLADRPGLPAPEPDAETAAFGAFDMEWLEREAPKILSSEESETFFAVVGTGKDTKDIARQMQVHEGTVKSRLHRAKGKLAAAWSNRKTGTE
jgi:transcriptional regulator with XRE-family HTH domain